MGRLPFRGLFAAVLVATIIGDTDGITGVHVALPGWLGAWAASAAPVFLLFANILNPLVSLRVKL